MHDLTLLTCFTLGRVGIVIMTVNLVRITLRIGKNGDVVNVRDA
jgi:hypothetical protein